MKIHKAIEANDLIALPEPMSDMLSSAVKRLVSNKYLMDKAIAEGNAAIFSDELTSNGVGPLEGSSFYREIFPFVPVWGRDDGQFSAFVPISQTIGCSWRWRGQHLQPEVREKCLRLFTDPDRARLAGGALELADFMWIQPIGLVLPHEGKNRVDFLREEGIEMIPARISVYDYPDASRIVLYNIAFYGTYECWAVLDARWVERVNHPTWSAPVLEAYGVPINQQWPVEFPAPQKVLEGFPYPAGNRSFLSTDIVDLEQITLEMAQQDEILPCAQHDLHLVQLRFKSIFWYWCAAIFISLFSTSLLERTWAVSIGIVVGVALGISIGLGLAYFLPLLRATRATLNHRWPSENMR